MSYSGSVDYSHCAMYYATKDGGITRLEIYTPVVADIVEMYTAVGFAVTKAIDTKPEISEKFSELHVFKKFP